MPKVTPVASAPKPKPKLTGPTVTFIGSNGNSVALPADGIKSTYGVSFSIPPIHYNIPASQANKLAAYWVNKGQVEGSPLWEPFTMHWLVW